MTVRRRKKKNKLRGHRAHGKGNTKNKRGAGSRGGRGRAGSHKHKFTKYYLEFGKEKKKVSGKCQAIALNLDQIEQFLPEWLASKKAQKKGNIVLVDGKRCGFEKLLARGRLNTKIVFENVAASARAIEKLRESGSIVKGAGESESGEAE